ncbi:hypothetical protein I7I50_09606 [Histoplasma capsulatum G186AR]|uniref:Uncharacterized protein n=1 Tax=Ajellomyces capsulatus TaxID=5037 RepID=A0A8H8D1I4_AJECA|nr:hypothetical protein I7I52_07136 [Histoplasma capsulatum]QSS74431.1 hypothetical protein I7I50_09606 [Histoplasma capsulatum G186AR]
MLNLKVLTRRVVGSSSTGFLWHIRFYSLHDCLIATCKINSVCVKLLVPICFSKPTTWMNGMKKWLFGPGWW